MKPMPLKAWAVVDARGRIFGWTISRRKRDADHYRNGSPLQFLDTRTIRVELRAEDRLRHSGDLENVVREELTSVWREIEAKLLVYTLAALCEYWDTFKPGIAIKKTEEAT